ncbi:hypothetical protein FDN13_09485 [Caloramator sp. E03]|uniref:hypothetical protein n=1 Tax=Caloramator sp. E03 TaxID=2576307 RepID=UPI0011103C49|nr:hypothetical protein [Caloramator sp. E03]QCX33913.1 hypothetical protein FDN13_09485 [Caloramator sp. E03]
MGEILIKEVSYKNYGKCLEISNGSIDALVTVDCGPRIIRFGFIGEENEFCDEAPVEIDFEDDKFYLRGGHRLWHSPENMPRTYMPDNKPLKWERIENGIRVSQDVEPHVQMKKELEITLDGKKNKLKVVHHLINKNAWAIKVSAWALTIMAPGGLEVIPQPKSDTGLLPNRNISIWSYTKMNDPRVYFGEKYITLTQNPSMKAAFKIGINNEDGWAAYFNHNNLFIKRFEHFKDRNYPDYGVSYETYTTDYMLEMETLSPLTVLEPDEEIVHIEEWELIKSVVRPNGKDEYEIERVLKEYIG